VISARGNKRLWGFAYVAGACVVFAIWIWGAETPMTSLNGDPRSTLDGLIYGTAHNPFVQRALVPLLTRTVYGTIPAAARETVRESLSSVPKVRKEAGRLGWDLTYLNEYLIALSFSFVALLLFPFALRDLFACLYAAEEKVVSLVPLAAMAALPPFFMVGTHYIYDFPALLLFTLGLRLLIQRRWLPYYAVLAIGCVNKETMVLLALPLFLLFRTLLPHRQLASHLALHVLLFSLIKGTLMLAYVGNPGEALEFHLWGNIHTLLMPYSLGALFSAGVLAALIWYEFDRKHPVLRKGAWLLVPFAGLMLFFGTATEVRALYEIFPVYALLIAHTIFFSLLKRPFELKDLEIPLYQPSIQKNRSSNGSRTNAGDPQTGLRQEKSRGRGAFTD
jgi:hypothetical protein